MDKFDRIYQLHNILRERRTPISRDDLMRRLECAEPTVYRLIRAMKDYLGAPIEWDDTRAGYYYRADIDGSSYELPGLWFNASEVLALLTTLRMLGDLQPGMLDGQIEPLRERLRAILGSGDHSWEEVEKRIRIFQPERRAGDPAHFGVIAAAVLKRTKL